MSESASLAAPAPQTTRAVLLIRPRNFASNPQTFATNRFQSQAGASPDLATRAAAEVDEVAKRLSAAGVTALVCDDTEEPTKPDAIFPGNWVSFHSDGRVVLYPMHAANRRAERRPEILDAVVGQGFGIREKIDLSALEDDGLALEGTGSLVLDRPRRIAYATLSSRTAPAALQEFARQTGYQVHVFRTEYAGTAVYHTNVMLAIGERFAVVCDAVLQDPDERAALLHDLAMSGRDIIQIDVRQMEQYAANLLELDTPRGAVIAMSDSALQGLETSQRRRLETHGRLLAVPLPAAERGGGSLRCMLAEVFLPRTNGAGG